jgi:eukaryotic-like serine/threonine-protein kinase
VNPIALASPLGAVARTVGHGTAALEDANKRLEALRLVGHPGLWLPELVGFEPNGDVVTRGLRAPGIDLASLLHVRGSLDLGECVAVGIDVAEALSALHGAGLVHGDLSPANVVVTGRRVVLIDLVGGGRRNERGTPGFAAPERAVCASAASDVYSLGRLLSHLASDAARARIEAWAAPLTTPAANSRPTADEVAVALRLCAPPIPVSVPEMGVVAAVRALARGPEETTLKTPAGRPWRVRRAAIRSSLIAGIVVTVCGALAAIAAIVSAVMPGSVPLDISTFPLPADAATELTIQRFEALATGDVDAFLATTVEGSEARLADRDLAEGLASGVVRFEGLEVEVTGVEVIETRDQTATVKVTYIVAAHQFWDGTLPTEIEAATASAQLVIAWNEETGWQVEQARSLL